MQPHSRPFHFITSPAAQVEGNNASPRRFMKAAICYMRAGGGFVGIHSAFGTEYNWPYYEGLLGGTNYYNHASNQDGVIRIESTDASTNGIGPPGTEFAFRDEFFNLTPFPKGVKFLASVVTSSITSQTNTHPGHPNFHPMAWCHYYDGGRAFVTTLGHDRLAYSPRGGFAGAAQFRSLLLNGIKSAMGLLPFCT